MADLQLVPHTKRRGMTKARAARIFLANNGICCNCIRQIRPGESWFIEHYVPLSQGGADDDKNARPAHTKCKAAKDAADAASKAKRDRIVTAGWDRGQTSQLRSAPFPARQKQNSATRPIIRKSERLSP